MIVFGLRGGPTLKIDELEIRRMRHMADNARPHETGGILIGRYSADRNCAEVVRISGPPRDSKSGPTWFTRGTRGLDQLLKRAWREGLHYVGDWHYHPAGCPEPSPSDRAQMSQISSEPKMQCATPILLILGDAGTGPQIAAYVHIDDELLPLTLADDANKTGPHLGHRVRG